MKIGVLGLWHLGAVTCACLAAAGFDTVGVADDPLEAERLSSGQPPLHEPGLAELMQQGLDRGTLSFTSDPAALEDRDIVWVTFDTPVDEDDKADVQFVCDRVIGIFPHLRDGTAVLISSQLPVGSTRSLEKRFNMEAGQRRVAFAYSPENLRLGQAIDVFTHPERVVVGVEDDGAREVLDEVLSRFCSSIIWTNVESAEMVKHATNVWLATSIVLTNEMASLCERVGGNFEVVESALRLDPRIGRRAYVRAGAAFGGGTLARDVRFLEDVSEQVGVAVPLIAAVRDSNARHRAWISRQLVDRLGDLRGRKIGMLGLAYKAGTDSIRRSVAIDLASSLAVDGAEVHAFDPEVRRLPATLSRSIRVEPEIAAVFDGANAVIIATDWPAFKSAPFAELVPSMRTRLVIDQGGFLRPVFASGELAADYACLGRAP